MFGCIRRLGCLVILIAAAAAAYFYFHPFDRKEGSSAAPRVLWEPLSQSKGEYVRREIQALGKPNGPVFTNLSGAEAASYLLLMATKQLPASARNAEAAVVGEELNVRANISLKEFGGAKALGPLASIIGDRDSVLFAGTLQVVEPGLGQFVVRRLKLGRLPIPSQLIPRLIDEFRKGDRASGVATNALPMPMPEYISDIRIANGRITVYKNLP